MKRLLAIGALGALVGCTFGASGPQNAASTANVMTIDVSLTAHPAIATAAGNAGGYAPAVLTVAVGTRIQFKNSDSFAHTATSLIGTTFPASSPFDASALSPHGNSLSSAWSAGNLAAGASSPVFTADKPGVYLYGCFYHYGAPMRGEIVVQ